MPTEAALRVISMLILRERSDTSAAVHATDCYSCTDRGTLFEMPDTRRAVSACRAMQNKASALRPVRDEPPAPRSAREQRYNHADVSVADAAARKRAMMRALFQFMRRF